MESGEEGGGRRRQVSSARTHIRIAGHIPSLDVGTGVRPGGWFVRPRTGTGKSAQDGRIWQSQVKLLPPRERFQRRAGAVASFPDDQPNVGTSIVNKKQRRHRTKRPCHSSLQCRFLANRSAQMPLTQSAKGNTPWSFVISNRTADSLVEPGILRVVKCLPRWPGGSS